MCHGISLVFPLVLDDAMTPLIITYSNLIPYLNLRYYHHFYQPPMLLLPHNYDA